LAISMPTYTISLELVIVGPPFIKFYIQLNFTGVLPNYGLLIPMVLRL
jgi:hypothetical protein